VTEVERRFGARPVDPIVESKVFNAARRTVTLLVEAGPDCAFWQIYRHEDCLLREHGQGGRAAVIQKLEASRAQTDVRFLAVVDADFDRLPGALGLAESPDVILTDGHDLETTLLGTPALEKMVRHAKGATNADDEARWRESTRSRLFRHGRGMGGLRWLKVRARLESLAFKKPGRGSTKGQIEPFGRYDDCVDADWLPSLARAVHAVLNYSQAQALAGERDLVAEVQALPAVDDAQLCNGHDLLGFLGVYLAPGNRAVAREEDLHGDLVLATERAWVAQTRMWASIRAWERAHPGFRVLTDDP
jgi:hypothetical protein